MKIQMKSYGAAFDLHCPRCGRTNFSDEIFENTYRKCLNCGADVTVEEDFKIDIIVEDAFGELTSYTRRDIKNALKDEGWKLP